MIRCGRGLKGRRAAAAGEGQIGSNKAVDDYLQMHALRTRLKACASLEEHLLPAPLPIVQKWHYMRLFPEPLGRNEFTNESGNILPGSAVDHGIACPTETHFCMCNAGVQVQLFVQMVDRSISVQVTHESTVKSAVYLAISKTKFKMEDFYVQHENRVLDLDKSLVAEKIARDSTFKVFPRMRGGYGNMSRITFDCMSLDEHIESLPEDEWIEERRVPMNLIGGSIKIRKGRSKSGQEYVLLKMGTQTFHKLFEMVSLFHKRGNSLDGSFEYEHIRYLPLTDSYFIDPDHFKSKVVKFTPDGYRKDINALGKVLRQVGNSKFKSSGRVINPAYVDHLLGIMESMPNDKKNSSTFKAFLRNHLCMMSPGSRQ